MIVVIMVSVRVQDLIGFICWQYISEGWELKFNDNVSVYCLYIVEDDGEVDIDFFLLDFNEFIYKFGFSILVLVEKYLFFGLIFKELFFV